MDNYTKYLNKKQKLRVENYKCINDIDFLSDGINKGDRIKFIKKKNLFFREGGIIENIIDNNTLEIKNIRYNFCYYINCDNSIILHKSKNYKKKDDTEREVFEYILNGLNNNTIKITKKKV